VASAADVMHRYGRDPAATAVRTEFVEGRLARR
jgi:hypothetical protein